MKPPRNQMFVERRAYRLRRIMDGARMLPLLGLVMVILPLLWAPTDGGSRNLAGDAIYIFAIWAALILAARALASGLSGSAPSQPED